MEINNEMKEYKYLHKIYNDKNKYNNNSDNHIIAKYINNNFNKMNTEEKNI